MRALISSILILAIFLFGTLYINNNVTEDSQAIIKQINRLEDNINKGAWTQAQGSLKELKENWESTRRFWELFLEHYEMDAIDITLAKADSYVKNKDSNLSLAEISQLKLLIDHIAQKDKLKLRNIF